MSNEDPSILSISVKEDVKAKPVGMGEDASGMSPEERNQRIQEEYQKLLSLYVEPHSKPGRWVKTADLPRIVEEAHEMIMLCNVPRGKQVGGAHAIAHTQVNDQDPLRFFVLRNGMVVINPVIVNHTNYTVFKEEGCMSYPDREMAPLVPRYHKVVVMFQSIAKLPDGKIVMTAPMTENLSSLTAEIFQHECAHCNGHYIYDEGVKPEWCTWLEDNRPMNLDELSALFEEKNENKESGTA